MLKIATIIVMCLAIYLDTSCAKISAKYGEIIIEDYDSCKIKGNGVEYNYTKGETVPGLWFGLIDYTCDGYYGHIVSKVECKPCGLFCIYNEIIPECKQTTLPLIIGISIGAGIGAIMMALVIKFGPTLVKWIVYKSVIIFYYFKDKETIKMTKRIKRTTNSKVVNIPLKDIKVKNIKCHKKIEENRSNLVNKNLPTDPDYIDIVEARKDLDITYGIEKDVVAEIHNYIKKGKSLRLGGQDKQESSSHYNELKPIVPTAPLEHKVAYSSPKPNVPRRPSLSGSSTLAKTAVTGLAIMSQIDLSNCCDQTLFMTSTGKICDDKMCKDLNMYNLPLQSGQTICFKDIDGEVFIMTIEKAYYRTRYQLIYYTTDFKMITDSYYQCKGSGECWEGGCHKMSKGEGFNNDVDGKIHSYSCQIDSLGCDTWCYHGSACTYFKWSIEEIGEQIPIYESVSKIWEVSIIIKYKEAVKRVTLNVNNPSSNINDINLLKFNELPLFITSFSSEEYTLKNYMAKISDSILNIEASPIGMPIKSLIGDYQVDIKNNTRIFDTEDVNCQVNSCKPICSTSQPKIQRLYKMVSRQAKSQSSYKMISDKTVLEHIQPVKALVNLMIGNVEFNNLHIIPASCDLNIIMTYKCEGCNTKPYAVVQSSKIKQTGIIPFESNCTFQTNFLSCNQDPYTVELLDGNTHCYIYLPNLNATLYLNFTSVFLGQLDPLKTLYSTESDISVFKAAVKSESFWIGLTNTVMAFSIFSVASAVVIRLVKVLTLYKVKDTKNVDKV